MGIDVRVVIYGPGGDALLTIDSANSNHGPEPLLLVADETGNYRISILISDQVGRGATYRIDALRITRATARDRRAASALRDYYQTRALSKAKNADRQKILIGFQSAALALDKAGGPTEARALAWDELGQVRGSLKDRRGSIEAYKKAAALAHQLGWKAGEAHAFNEIAQNNKFLFRVDDAVGYFQKALALAREARDVKQTAVVLTNLGFFHADRGEILQADRYLSEAVSLWKLQRDSDGESSALNALGLAYQRIGDFDEALAIYERERRFDLTPLRRAVLYTQIGLALIDAGSLTRALDFFDKAHKLQDGKDLENQAKTLTGFGLVYSRQGNYSDALGSYRRALSIFESQKDIDSQIRTHVNIGWALAGMGHYDEARASFSKSLELVKPDSQDHAILESIIALGFAWNEQQRGNLNEALRHAERAVEPIESLRSGTQDEGMRLSFFAANQNPYDLLIEILMSQYDLRPDPRFLARAFEVSESSRARALLDEVRERGLGMTDRRKPVLSLSEIQSRVLDPKTVLLEYSLGRTRSYLWKVTQTGIERYDLPPGPQIEKLAEETYQALAKSNLREERARVVAKLRHLSDVLLRPLAGRLYDKRLLIVASGALQSIPFSILPDPDISYSMPGKKGLWPQSLLVRHEVVSEPSVSVLGQIRQIRMKRPPASKVMAVLADGVFSSKDKRLPLHTTFQKGGNSLLDRLTPLKDSRREAETITIGLRPMDVTKLFDFEARKDNVLKGALRDHKVLHFALHTLYPSRNPDTAAIVLSRFDRKGREIDGLLRVEDIAGLDLRSDLVVLSSCKSAWGRTVSGEGMIGLPRAFFAAGASSVIMSLWDVGDSVTADLMDSFYRHLRNGRISPSAALREAQIEISKDHRRSPPWFWAGFVAQGEWDIQPIFLNKTPSAVSPKGGNPRRPATTTKLPPTVPLR